MLIGTPELFNFPQFSRGAANATAEHVVKRLPTRPRMRAACTLVQFATDLTASWNEGHALRIRSARACAPTTVPHTMQPAGTVCGPPG